MRALLMKDFYVLFKQMKLFFVMILFFSLIPNQNMASFAAVYAGMLPFSALAYDEQSKWDQLAVTMPYSRRDLVLSKYVLGYLACGASMLLCLGITGLCAALKLPVGNTFAPGTALLMAAFGPIFVAVTLPLMFRFGVEQGRMITLLAMGLAAGCMVGLMLLLPDEMTQAEEPAVALTTMAWGLCIALNAASIWLSEKWYGSRNR